MAANLIPALHTIAMMVAVFAVSVGSLVGWAVLMDRPGSL